MIPHIWGPSFLRISYLNAISILLHAQIDFRLLLKIKKMESEKNQKGLLEKRKQQEARESIKIELPRIENPFKQQA